MKTRVLILLILLTFAGSARVPLAAAPTASLSLAPAGDLDADGLGDVVGWTTLPNDDVVVEARRGRDGAVLWSQQRSQADGYPFAARVGASGTSGLLLSGSEGLQTTPTWLIRQNFTALAADGTILWRSSVSGANAWTPVGYFRHRIPQEWFFLDATPGPAQDILVERMSRRTLTGGTTLSRVEALVISGETGAITAHAAGDWTAQDAGTEPTGDLDGDGGDDFLLYNRSFTTFEIAARSGRDGRALWTTTVPINGDCAGAVDVGDLTGDGRDELAASTICDAQLDSLYLLDGAAGTVLWSGDDRRPARLGDVDGDGRGEFATTTESSTAGEWAVAHAARHADGSLVYRTHATVPVASGGPVGRRLSVNAVGDVDRDGIPDVAHALITDGGSSSSYAEHRTVISGRTGASLWPQPREPRALEEPLRSSVDGDGDDLVRATFADGGPYTVRAVDGRTGDTIWEAPILGVARYKVQFLAADLDGDGRAEVLAESPFAIGAAHHSYVLSGTDGHVLWYS